MLRIKHLFKSFSTFELITIALVSALGIAVKPVVVPLAHMITAPLLLPGGAVAGGLYMLWVVLGAGLIKRKGTATIIGIVQALIVIVTGVFGTHGVLSIITYTVPGIAVDLSNMLMSKRAYKTEGFFTAGIAANTAGTIAATLLFFRLPLIPLLLGLCTAALSGGMGGLLAGKIVKELSKYNIYN